MMTTRARSRRRAGLGSVAVVAVVGAVTLAACGGGSSKAKTTPTSASAASSRSTANRQALQAYRTCLQQHGVSNFGFGRRNGGTGANGGTPGTGQPPVSRPPLSAADRAKLQAAQQACQSKLPSGFAQQRQQDLAAYRSCLRDHGVNVPATTDSTGGLGFGGTGGIDRNDPKFQAANKICAPLLPAGGFGRRDGGAGGTATTGGAPNAAAARTGSTV